MRRDVMDNDLAGDDLMGDDLMGDDLMGDDLMGDDLMGDDLMRGDVRVRPLVRLCNRVPVSGRGRALFGCKRSNLWILHHRVIRYDANLAVALHEDEVFTLHRTQVAKNAQVVVGRHRPRAGENDATEQCC
jgi:hypothetical protein